MRGLLSKKKMRVALGIVVTVLACVTGAFAYWTSLGEGTGSVTASSGGAGFTVTNSTVGGVYPGGESALIHTVVSNSDTNQPEYLTSLRTTISVNESGVSEPHHGCEASWFKYKSGAGTTANPFTLAIGEEIAKSPATKTVEGHVLMEDTGTNQDVCKGATLTLTYAAS
jgi:hypothetical protein